MLIRQAKPLKIVTWKDHKNPSQVSSGVKSCVITVVGCVGAGGQCLPPMVGANSDDSRYQVWLKMYQPTCNSTLLSDSSLSDFLLPDSPLPDIYQPALKHSSLDGFLDCPDPPQRHPAANEQHSIWVLTSSENLESMEEKGKEKQRKAREKEEQK